jgi:hypothetical protein
MKGWRLCIFGIPEGIGVKIRDFRHLRQRITDSCATVDFSMLSKIRTNMVKRLRKCVECRGEHTEHIM